MLYHPRPVRLLMVTLLAFGLTGCVQGHGTRADRIDGVVLGASDGAEVPLGEVSVQIRPVGGETTDLVGVALTNYAGNFQIDTLSSQSTLEEHGLIRGTVYNVRIIAYEYYVLDKTFEYGKGSERWEFVLDRKDSDLNDVGPPITDTDGDPPPPGLGGSVRKG